MNNLTKVISLVLFASVAAAQYQANLNSAQRKAVSTQSRFAKCDGTSNDGAMFATLARSEVTTLQLPIGKCRVKSNVTLPPSVALQIPNGGGFLIEDGATLTINGSIEAGSYQIFQLTGTGQVSFSSSRSIRLADPRWWGAVCNGTTNDSAAIQAAINALGFAGAVTLPGNISFTSTCAFSSTIQMKSGITLDLNGGTLKWVGSKEPTVPAILLAKTTRATIRNGIITTNIAGATAIKHETAIETTLENLAIRSDFPSKGFHTVLRYTGDGVSLHSDNNTVRNCYFSWMVKYSILMDHTIATNLENVDYYAAANDVNVIHWVFDRDVADVVVSDNRLLHGLHAAVWQYKNLGGAYGPWPTQFHIVNTSFDTSSGGAELLFDSSLPSPNYLAAHFSNCWCSGAGLSDTQAVVTASANCIEIRGGSYIYWQGGSIRASAANGVFVNSPTSRFIQINNTVMDTNNQAANPDSNGIWIASVGGHVQIKGNQISNIIDTLVTGHMKYAIRSDATIAPQIVITENEVGDVEHTNTPILYPANNRNYTVFNNPPSRNTNVPAINVLGTTLSAKYGTATNCSSTTSPAVCSDNSAGSVAIPVGSTTLIVNTTAVTANSQIIVIFDSSLNKKLGITCNTDAAAVGIPHVSDRTANSSFTIAVSGSVTENPACFSFIMLN